MTCFERFLACTAAVLAFSTGPTGSLLAQTGPMVRDTSLENGLHVIVVPNHRSPVVTLEVVLRAGAFTQLEPEDEGIPHVLEHMLFRAYGGRGWGSYAAAVGAVSNATTNPERVTYFVTLPSRNADGGLELLGNLFREPSFDGRELERELRVVLGELERRTSDPYFVLTAAHDRVLWGSAFQRKNTIGNMNSVLGARATRLDHHYRQFYVPNNAALIVSGDVDVEETFERARDRFGRWRRGPDPFINFPALAVAPLTSDRVGVVDAYGSDVTFMIGWHGPSAGVDPVGAHAAEVFAELLGQPTSGTQRRLVDTGAFQSVSMSYHALRNVGQVTLLARTTSDELGTALEKLGEELAHMARADYFTEADLVAAKKRLRVRRALSRESTPGTAHTLAAYWSVGGLDYFTSLDADMQSISIDDVRAYLTRFITGQPKVVSALGTRSTYATLVRDLAEAVRRWGTAGGPPGSRR